MSSANTTSQQSSTDRGFYNLVLWIFLASMVFLCGMTVFAVLNDSLTSIITVAGLIYMILSFAFLCVMAWAFISGHLGGAREIEDPKMQIFQLEDNNHTTTSRE